MCELVEHHSIIDARTTPMARLVPICKDLKQQILQCYKQNPGRSLDCSDAVRNYQQCVNNARKVHSKHFTEVVDFITCTAGSTGKVTGSLSKHAHTNTHMINISQCLMFFSMRSK